MGAGARFRIGTSTNAFHVVCAADRLLPMPVNKTITPDLVQKVLGMWNIAPDHVSLIKAKGNTHWRVQRGREDFILRMYRRGQTGSSIRYELDILRRLHDRGWPVAADVDGVVWREDSAFVLFPLLPGHPHMPENDQRRRRRGRILAELHFELGTLSGLGQRSGWRRVDEVVLEGERLCDQGSKRTLSMSRPDLFRIVARYLEGVRDRLCAAGASNLPVTVVHGDLIAQNLLFQDGTLSGVLDFDSAHLDLRAADVACARRSRYDEVARGYLEVIPLSDEELGCLDDIWRANVLRYALQLIDCETTTDVAISELEWCVAQLEKTLPFHG
jgi:Ser/Thr protein kinase RdoA (MazF antagonist)